MSRDIDSTLLGVGRFAARRSTNAPRHTQAAAVSARARSYRGAMDLVLMAAGANPLLPTSWEFMTLLLGGALIALLVVAVISLSRDRYYTPGQRLLWLLVILVAPVLGPVLWLAVGRNRVLDRQER